MFPDASPSCWLPGQPWLILTGLSAVAISSPRCSRSSSMMYGHALVPGLHARRPRHDLGADWDEFPSGPVAADCAGEDHGHAGGHRATSRRWASARGGWRPIILAGGNVPNVIRALIAAHRADLDLNFDRAAAIDLAGRSVLEAVQTSVYPKVIDCPDPAKSHKSTLGAIAKNGVELRVRARVTVRTNLKRLIGGATEETIIARVGEGIITAIGSSDTHLMVMENPDRISKAVLERGLDAQTAFEIVSIDIADMDVGENIGARLQADQAEADTRVARAKAEAAACPGPGPRAGNEGRSGPEPRPGLSGRGRGAAGHGRRVPRGESGARPETQLARVSRFRDGEAPAEPSETGRIVAEPKRSGVSISPAPELPPSEHAVFPRDCAPFVPHASSLRVTNRLATCLSLKGSNTIAQGNALGWRAAARSGAL